ncbi:hypothetical protein LTR84_002301 [Exophiala bonariae]|uniref:Deacetylase sirtuin-type domain-containing protein n=1 Tax=Exophiala bonariae TaxID=1690606 RepID=A0AAV9NEU5_9EURO|nr:hypothetical protein LTR84_002301 [Exophiala bonariae]
MVLQDIRSTDERQLQEIADVLAGSHKVIVVTGAGISTSCGIPDFRSKDGLYNIIPEQAMLPTPPSSQPATPTLKRTISLIEEEDFPSSQTSTTSTSSRRSSASPSSKLRGQDLFDSRVFQNAASTTVFYRFIASLRQKIRDEVKATSSVHKFLRVLRDGGRLMRCYTQNIDGLERREGLVTDLTRGKGNKRRFMKKHYEVPRPSHAQGTDFDGGCEVVQLHGDLEKLRCTMCAAHYEWTDEETEIYLEGAAPNCQKCKAKSEDRKASGKRGLAMGCLRPNIVLYGEDHPSNSLLTPLIPFDASCQPEVMIIMGTSLKVFGLQKIVREFAKSVHAHKNGKGRVIFVNRTRPADSVWEGIIDDFVSMDCDDWVEDLRTRRSDLWLRQGEIDMTIKKASQPRKKRKSVAEGGEVENMPTKKARITVEIPRLIHPLPRKPLQKSTPNLSTPSKSRFGVADVARKMLSPLAQAKRPPMSPLTSPVRPDDEDGMSRERRLLSPRVQVKRPSFSPLTSPVKPDNDEDTCGRRSPAHRITPLTPMFSPIAPADHAGSTLKIQVLPDEVMEDETIMIDETPTQEGKIALALKKPTKTPGPRISPKTQKMKDGRRLGLGAQLWEYITDERSSSPYSPASEHFEGDVEGEGDIEDDMIVVNTPSRGPKGRKIDVFCQIKAR